MRNYPTRTYDYIDTATGCHVVKATTMYAGKKVSTAAKCDPGDEFDLEFGKKVAMKRLDQKIELKRAATSRNRAATYQEIIDFYKNEIKRLTKAKENAEVFAADRMVEAANIERELAEMFATLR